MSKKILVTGSNGLLGQKLTDLILTSKHHLVATGLGTNRYPTKTGYEYDLMDICNFEQMESVLSKHRPDAIIHTAAMTNVDLSEQKKEECWQQNVVSVEHLVQLCQKMNIQLVHLSTDFIFDGKDGPYPENAIPNPLSYYGHSKLKAEQVIQQSKCHYAILRTVLVYGIVADMSRSNIVLWAKGALEKGSPINVVNDQWRTPTLAEDLAMGCLLAVEKQAQGVYNISGKDMMNMVELVQKVAKFWNLNATIINEVSSQTLKQLAVRPPKTGFILDKSIKELGYCPHSFEEGLQMLHKQLP